MGWIERFIYIALIVALYCVGRFHGENREQINRALRANEFSKALNENRIEDIEYRLQDDIKVCVFNSFTSFSFGPNLWQSPLPQEKITISLEKNETKPVNLEEAPQKNPQNLNIVEPPLAPAETPVSEVK